MHGFSSFEYIEILRNSFACLQSDVIFMQIEHLENCCWKVLLVAYIQIYIVVYINVVDIIIIVVFIIIVVIIVVFVQTLGLGVVKFQKLIFNLMCSTMISIENDTCSQSIRTKVFCMSVACAQYP